MKNLLLSVIVVAALVSPVARAATLTVTSTADDGSVGTLRLVIADASAGDTIDFSVATPATITLTNGELLIDKDLTILGPGLADLAVDGNAASRVFHITNGVTATISGLTITNGSAGSGFGGGIYNDHSTLSVSNCTLSGNSGNFGGAIGNDGSSGSATLTIDASTFSGNSSGGFGGGLYNFAFNGITTLSVSASTFSGNSARIAGGGIDNQTSNSGNTTVTIATSTFSGNSAAGAFGGGGGAIDSNGGSGNATVTIAASTFSGNSSGGGGGGIQNDAFAGSATLSVNASTLSDNSSGGAGGGINNVSGTLQIGDTILKAGASGANIANGSGSVTSRGYNLSSDNGGGFLTGTADQTNTDPMLGPLQDNGGPTFTHELLPGSPAIDKGKRNAIPALALNTDQRGFPRPLDFANTPNAPGGDGSDIGAFEVQPPPSADLLVSLGADKTSVKQGDTLTYTITVQNFGPDDAGNVLVNDTLSSGTTFVNAQANVGASGGKSGKMAGYGIYPDTSLPLRRLGWSRAATTAAAAPPPDLNRPKWLLNKMLTEILDNQRDILTMLKLGNWPK